jgi:hypothetical protein
MGTHLRALKYSLFATLKCFICIVLALTYDQNTQYRWALLSLCYNFALRSLRNHPLTPRPLPIKREREDSESPSLLVGAGHVQSQKPLSPTLSPQAGKGSQTAQQVPPRVRAGM